MKNRRIFGNEKKYLDDVLKNQFRSSKNGYMVKKFENKFAKIFNSKYAIAFTNGTSTMHACLEAIGVGIGDEVIVPPLTMASTTLAVLHCNATPIFADVDIETFQIDPLSIEKKITKKTKAIITVSLYGLSPDITKILKIANRFNIKVIEDNAECFLGYYKKKIIGNLGHMSSYSLQGTKHISCGEGGVVTTNSAKTARNIRLAQSLGYSTLNAKKNKIPKELLGSPNFNRHITLGWNYRMSDLCAAVALGQLENLKTFVKLRVDCAKLYNQISKDYKWFVTQKVRHKYKHSYWTWAAYIKNNKIKWLNFKKKFISFGGTAIYGCWKLTYKESFFMKNNFNKRQKLISQKNLKYYKSNNLCPNAEYLQPRLFQFKTNFYNLNEAKKETLALKKTLDYFDKLI
jgi:perosamine synthetase